MKSQLDLHHALMCLQALDAERERALSAMDISRRQGVPVEECRLLLGRLSDAGLIETDEKERFRLGRDLSDLTALEVVQAVTAASPKAPRFRLWFGADRRLGLQKTLEAVRWAEQHGVYQSESGRV